MTEETAGTPRTDALVKPFTRGIRLTRPTENAVLDLARQLEREVAALTAERARDKVTHDLDLHGKMLEAATKQLREANARAEAAEAELDAAKRALVEIARGPLMPLPDPGAHSWRAFGEAAYRAMTEGMRKASAALAAKSAEQKEEK